MEYKQGGNWVDIWIKTRVINITRFWCAATVLVKVDNLFKEYLLPFTNMNRNNYKRKIIGNCQVLSVYAVKRNGFSIYKQICSQKKSFAKCGTRDELINYKINGCIFVWIDGKRGFYKSSSSLVLQGLLGKKVFFFLLLLLLQSCFSRLIWGCFGWFGGFLLETLLSFVI